MFGEIMTNIEKKGPVVHNITNYVTVNDCANIVIAAKASPIMSDDAGEVEEITAICGALNINIGTLNANTVPSMFAAGKKSNELGHPVVLDPVGAGASKLRTETAKGLIEKVKFSVIRGNMSEIKVLATGIGAARGVDVSKDDVVDADGLGAAVRFAADFSKKTGAVIAITGATDIVANGEKAYVIKNGHPMMANITGSGCMLSAMTAAYIAANPDNILEAAAAAVCAMGICGERAVKRMTERDGNSSYRNYLIDEVYNLTPEILDSESKFEIMYFDK